MYSDHFRAFSEDVEFSARAFSYNVTLNDFVLHDKSIESVVNITSRFWLDYRFMALQACLISLGKIFSNDARDGSYKVHNIYKLIESAKSNLSYFSKEKLKVRKKNIENLEEYLKSAHELNYEDIDLIQKEADKAKDLWNSGPRNVRDKILAHNEILDEVSIKNTLQNVKYDDLRALIIILLNIERAFQEAENNGRKPSFSPSVDPDYPDLIDDNIGSLNRARGQISSLLLNLRGGDIS